MSIRTFRKAIGLLFVDIVIIIGIFVLQFRTDSNIIEKIGNLQVTLAKKENIDGEETELMNKFRVSYNGINLYSDEQNPVIVRGKGGKTKEVTLVSFVKTSDLSCALNFTDDISISFELSSDEAGASLAIIAKLPDNFTEILVPYNFASNMKIEDEDPSRVVLNKRKETWEMSASLLENGKVNLRKGNYIATYSIFEETEEFTFDSIVNLPIAELSVFETNRKTFNDNLIAAYKANTVEANLSEQVAVSYVAAMAERGQYTQAIEDIPQSFKKSDKRTYLSAPYFNTLEKMNTVLDNTIATYEQKISASAATGSLDVFTIHNIANFMAIHSNPAVVKTLLQNTVAAKTDVISLAQATGIIQVFVDLYKLQPDYAAILQPIIKPCLDRIAQACAYDGNVLTISENDTFLSVIQAIETGIAVMRYGEVMGDAVLQKAGNVIVNSYLSGSASFDLRTLANLYPLIAYNNPYYPHFEKINSENGKTMWAWTCAKDIAYQKDAEGAITITIDFPEGATHYVIIKGLPRFKTIYIYDMQFRTDYRFETYNSSGYVYKDKFQTLLLKSRHKKQFENVRFVYAPKVETPVVEETTDTKTAEGESATTTTEEKGEVKEDNSETATATEEPNSEVEAVPDKKDKKDKK